MALDKEHPYWEVPHKYFKLARKSIYEIWTAEQFKSHKLRPDTLRPLQISTFKSLARWSTIVWKPERPIESRWMSVHAGKRVGARALVCMCVWGWESCHFEEWETVAVGSSLADVQKEHQAYWSIKYANSSCWLKREINKVQ